MLREGELCPDVPDVSAQEVPDRGWLGTVGGMRFPRRSFVAVAASIALVAGVVPAHADSSAAFAPIRPQAKPGRVVMLGDSLAHEVSGVVQFLTAPRPVTPKFWGGTAPCDWLDVDLEADRSAVVVVSFTGNSLTPCMADGNGGYLRGEALVARYRADLTVLVDRIRAAGAWALVVGQPLRDPSFGADAEVDGINAVYRELARRPYVSFVDAGGFVERDGAYTDRLPCAPIEPVCGPDGQNIVRGDGVHFCPTPGPPGACDEWSSGALRFGLVITVAALRPAAFE